MAVHQRGKRFYDALIIINVLGVVDMAFLAAINTGFLRYGSIANGLIFVLWIVAVYRMRSRVISGGVAPTPLPQSVKRRLYTLWSVIAVVEAVEVYAVIIHFLTVYEALALIAIQAVIAALYTWRVMHSKK